MTHYHYKISNYLNRDVIEKHEYICQLNIDWLQHLNYLLENALFVGEEVLIQDEIVGTLFYDT